MSKQRSVVERQETLKEDRWNVEALFTDWNDWRSAFNRLTKQGDGVFKWPELSQGKTDLTSASDLKKLFDSYMDVDAKLDALYTYAHLRHDEDVAEKEGLEGFSLAMGAFHSFKEETSWIDPALLQLSQDVLDRLVGSEELADYKNYLRKIVRLKPYTLGANEEKLLAFAGKALGASQKAFGAFNNADLHFPKCLDEEGNEHDLTHGVYQLYLKGKDRVLRKEAFTGLHQTFAQYENTLCELIQGVVEQHVFYKKARGYESCLEAALYPHEIDESVYHSLISTVKKNVSVLHEYLGLRKELLGYSELHPYDLAVSLVDEVEIDLSYEDAVAAVIESVSPLGAEYQEILRKGLEEDGWVDRYENKRKRSGAYSSGCYTSMPYILLNYHGTFNDAMTLTHEAGHSMHSYFSRKNQKYVDHQYPIFLAEVASTFHEELLFQHFLKKAQTPKEKAFLLNQKIDAIRNTFFRQTMFAEFELRLHEWVESGVPLTANLLKEEYERLSKEYFGDAVTLDPCLANEWSRIPHFYYNFYVYQYATGISAADVLAKQVLSGDLLAKERYLNFISSGSIKDPVKTLQEAGVDMQQSYVVESLLQHFKNLVGEFKELIKENM